MTDPRYTHGHAESVLSSHRWRTAANSAAYLLPHLRPGSNLLDVGAGPGTITADFAEITAPGRVTALEATDEAVGITRQGVADRWVDNVDFVVGDVHALEFDDDTFDVVHAHQVLQHVADPVRALREMRRVCKPGGIVAARDSDYSAFTWYPEIPELDEWLALYLQVARSNGGEPDAGRHLVAWAHDAGFTDVTASANAWCFANPGRARFWGAMWAERIVHSAIAGQIVADGLGTTDDLERISSGWRRWASHPDAMFTTTLGEIICRP
ncbi:MAG: methyltransferase domain-containing protein [Actinobacteria bacterium]|nr:methyltransferase domain-containing protein [Actinomycetota bacterium]